MDVYIVSRYADPVESRRFWTWKEASGNYGNYLLPANIKKIPSAQSSDSGKLSWTLESSELRILANSELGELC